MRFLVFMMCVLFGSVSCLQGDPSSKSKRHIADIKDEYFIDTLCKGKRGYDSWEEGMEYSDWVLDIKVHSNSLNHPSISFNNRQKEDMFDSTIDGGLLAIAGGGGVGVKGVSVWNTNFAGRSRQLRMNTPAIKWFKEHAVECVRFKNGYPFFRFDDNEVLSEGGDGRGDNDGSDKGWYFIGLRDGSMTLVVELYYRCDSNDSSCNKAQVLRFDEYGRLLKSAYLVEGSYQPISGEILSPTVYHHQ